MDAHRDPAIWIDAIKVEIRGGICFAHVRSGNSEIEMRASVATGVDAAESFAAAYSAFQTENGREADIVKLSRRGPLFLREDTGKG